MLADWARGGRLALIGLVMMALIAANVNVEYAYAEDDVVTRSLHGTIVDEAGVPVAGATVQIGTYNPDQGFRFVASGAANESGVYEVSYNKILGDAVSAILHVRGFVVVYEVTGDTLDFQIPQERGTITGKLTFGDQFATPAVGYPLSLSVYLGRGEGRVYIDQVQTDEDGRYTFSFLPGQFNSARGENQFSLIYNQNEEQLVRMNLGDYVEMDRVVWDWSPGYMNGMLQVDVTDAETNEPIEDAVVELAGTNIPLFQTGHYFFSDVLRGGPYTVVASAPGYSTTEESIVINGGIYPLSVKLTKAANPPVVTAVAERAPDRGGWYNRDVLVTFHAEGEDAGVVVDPPVLVTSEGAEQIITGTARDAAGTVGTGSIVISMDKSAPVTTAVVEGEGGESGGDPSGVRWYLNDVSITLDAADPLSGVETTVYSLDRGRTWRPYNGPVAFTREGEHRLLFRSTDAAGNTEDIQTLVVKIDRTKPILLAIVNPLILTPANNKLIPVHAHVFGTDIGSGIDSIELTSITIYDNNGSSPVPPGDDIQKAEFGTFDTDFVLRAEAPSLGLSRQYKVTYTATDRAGNKTAATAVVSVAKLWQFPW